MIKKDILKLIKVKTYLLCYGIRENRYSEEFYKIQNPYDIKKSGYVGLHFILENKLVVLASTTYKFDKFSQFVIDKERDQFYIVSAKGEKYKIKPIQMPSWYKRSTTSRKPLTQIYAHEGLHYLHQLYSGCAYQNCNMGCKFCGNVGKWLVNTPQEVSEAAILACQKNSFYHICLGGGTRLDPGRGTEYFLECVKLIRKKNKKNPIWIEMVPPESNGYIQDLIDAGASSLSFNIELWNEKYRKQICPGKSLISRERYFSAWKYVQKKLGKDKIGTCLISGLEPFNSTLEGIKEITRKGVHLTLLPFKPWDGSAFEKKKPPNVQEHFDLAYNLAENMKKYYIDNSENHGCQNCSSCTIEDDILKYILNKSQINY